MSEKNEYVKGLLDDNYEYPREAMFALITFKRDNRFSNPAVPFTEHMAKRLQAMQVLVKSLCDIYNIPQVTVEGVAIEEGAQSLASFYSPPQRVIYMVGKLSIITLLHEFAHALLGANEDDARKWSVNIFRRAYPRAFENLANPEGHILVTNDRRETPAETGSIAITPNVASKVRS